MRNIAFAAYSPKGVTVSPIRGRGSSAGASPAGLLNFCTGRFWSIEPIACCGFHEMEHQPLLALSNPLISCYLSHCGARVKVNNKSRPVITKRVDSLSNANVHHLPFCFYEAESSRVLYWACKDVLPVRGTPGTKFCWRADLTIYHPDRLISRELNRSIGHRNGSNCVEIFEVWRGVVRMFLQPPDGNDTRPCVFVDIREGE